MNVLDIIKQEYVEYIVSYGSKFDNAIVSMSKNAVRKHIDGIIFEELRELEIPVLSNMRMVEKETLNHILKKVEKVNYKKLKNLFLYEKDVIDDLCRIVYDDEIEKYFERLSKKGFNTGESSFVFPEVLDITDFFSASELIEEIEEKQSDLFEDLNDMDTIYYPIADETAFELRKIGVRIFDTSIIFNTKKKMYQFLMCLEDSGMSEKNYKISSTKELFKIDIDSCYVYEKRLEKLLSYKNGFRKGQYKIVEYKPHLSNCVDFLLHSQEMLEK